MGSAQPPRLGDGTSYQLATGFVDEQRESAGHHLLDQGQLGRPDQAAAPSGQAAQRKQQPSEWHLSESERMDRCIRPLRRTGDISMVALRDVGPWKQPVQCVHDSSIRRRTAMSGLGG